MIRAARQIMLAIVHSAGSRGKVAARLASEGAQVALFDLNSEALERTKQDCGAALTIAVDVSDADAVSKAMAQCHQQLGALDLLACSAGITGATAMVEDYPLESWQQVINVNLNGVFYCCLSAIPFMLHRGYGRIVNISSVAGKVGNPNLSAYSAAKAGVIALTKSLGKELATSGILVNAVTPAVFATPMLDQMHKHRSII